MLTPAGLSLIIAMCTCCGHDSPRLRRFRTHARTFHTPVLSFHTDVSREISSAWSRQVGQGRLRPNFVRCAATGWRHPLYVLVTNTPRSQQIPDQYNPKPLVHRTFRAGLPSRSTGKRLRCRARSCDFRFAPSYLVIVMRSICVGDIRYIFTAAYIPARITRVTLCYYSISMCNGERCLSLPDILCKITVLEVAKRIARNYANDELWRADLPKIHTYNRTFENPGILKRYRGEKSERGVERKLERGRPGNVLAAAMEDFSETRIFHEISEKCSVQSEHHCDVCTICIH